MRVYSLLFIALISFSSCTVHRMAVDVYRPPEVPLPEKIKRIAVVNRLGEVPDQDIDNLVEGIFTGKGAFVHRMGAHQATLGLIDFLDYSRDFDELVRVHLNISDTGLTEMPEPLDWELLDIIRNNQDVDALVSLEYLYSTNLSYSETRREREQEKKNQVWTNTLVYNVAMEDKYIAVLKVQVETGWRVYDIRNQRILDEYSGRDSVFWEVDGSSRREALSRLPNRSRAVEEAGFLAGENYATRIVPGWSTVRRTFLTSGSRLYRGIRKKLKRRLWGDLQEIWERGVASEDPRTKAVAWYNMAILEEMEGNLDSSVELLEKAVETSNLPRAVSYLATIRDRQQEMQSHEEK